MFLMAVRSVSVLIPSMHSLLIVLVVPAVSLRQSAGEHPGLHNVINFSDQLINGSAPEGDRGFDSLKALGIKTIICVDGAAPDAARAETRGMRYVHLPIGYDGIDETEGLKLMRAIRDLPKPIYIHCYHGVHRSPAAAAYAVVRLGQAEPKEVLALMRRAGTSEKYTGLYEVVRQARPAGKLTIDAVKPDFPSKAAVSGVVRAMAAIGRSWDRMKLLNQAGWRTPPDHPDIDPANESKILAEYFKALCDDPKIKSRSEEFRQMLSGSLKLAEDLRQSMSGRIADAKNAESYFDRLKESCKSCHAQYRN